MSIRTNKRRKNLSIAIALGLFVSMMSIADITHSANRNDIYKVLLDTQPTWNIQSEVWINANEPDPSVRIGDSVVFSLSSTDYAYYQLFVVDSKGSTTILVPDELDSSFFPTKSFVYPPLPDGCQFPLSEACIRGNNLIQQEGPVGKESVFMLATDRKIPGYVFGIKKGQDAIMVAGGVDGVKVALEAFKTYVARNNIRYTTEAYSYAVDSDTQYTTRSLKSTFNARLSQIGNESEEAVSNRSGPSIAEIFALNSSAQSSNENASSSAESLVVSSELVAASEHTSQSDPVADNAGGGLASMFDLNDSSSETTGSNSNVSEPQIAVQEQFKDTAASPNTPAVPAQGGSLTSIFDLKESNTSSNTSVNPAVSEPEVRVQTQVQDTAPASGQNGNIASMFDLKDSSTAGSVATTVTEPEVISQENLATTVEVTNLPEDVPANVVSTRKKPNKIDESELVAEVDNRPKKKSEFEGLDLSDIDVMAYSRRSEPVILSDVSFESGSAVLGAKGQITLDGIGSELLDLQSANKLPVILIVGHTDSAGPDEDNFILSVNRAKVAKDYLVETFDIPAKKIISSGRGEFSPLFPNNSRENRARNRRVEISFLGR